MKFIIHTKKTKYAPAEREDQKTILNAGDYIDQQLYNALVEKYPNSKFNLNMVRTFKETHGFVGNSGGPVKSNIRQPLSSV